MPVRDESNVVTLGEGGTPMLRARNLERTLDARTLYIKDEGINPTGSFKARGLSAAVSRAKELGLMRLTVPSGGQRRGRAGVVLRSRGHGVLRVSCPRTRRWPTRKRRRSQGRT